MMPHNRIASDLPVLRLRSIKTFTGKRFYLAMPRVADVDIIDIAHSLSLQTRFVGHVREFYSVAQHCVHVADQVLRTGASHRVARQALLHDSTEAYTGDISRPLKADLGRTFAQYEQRIHFVICEAFRIPATLPLIVMDADDRMLATEARDLMGGLDDGDGDEPLADPYDFPIVSWEPKAAFRAFMDRFTELED